MSWIIELEVGDSSGDGHNITESFYIKSSQPMNQVEKMYKTGCKKLKVDLNKYANAYEDGLLPKKQYEILNKAGLQYFFKKHIEKFDKYAEPIKDREKYYGDGLCMTTALYTLIWLFITEQGDHNKGDQTSWEWSLHTVDSNKITIGGYGLLA